jgi:hypothetical protein
MFTRYGIGIHNIVMNTAEKLSLSVNLLKNVGGKFNQFIRTIDQITFTYATAIDYFSSSTFAMPINTLVPFGPKMYPKTRAMDND